MCVALAVALAVAVAVAIDELSWIALLTGLLYMCLSNTTVHELGSLVHWL